MTDLIQHLRAVMFTPEVLAQLGPIWGSMLLAFAVGSLMAVRRGDFRLDKFAGTVRRDLPYALVLTLALLFSGLIDQTLALVVGPLALAFVGEQLGSIRDNLGVASATSSVSQTLRFGRNDMPAPVDIEDGL